MNLTELEMQRSFYRYYDLDPRATGIALTEEQKKLKSGMFAINYSEAARWNELGYGIFWSVQKFKFGQRTKNDLEKILSWVVDIDGGDKTAHMKKIIQGLYPSLVIETKNGYHVYWNAKDATRENYSAIVEDRLINFYESDRNAKDLARALRAPGFKHLKNPSDPFEVKVVWRADVAYTETQMLEYYEPPKHLKNRTKEKSELRENLKSEGDDFWERVYEMDCIEALKKLSGSNAVRNEAFSFRKQSNGNFNIWVNGAGTSCFIDVDGRIGSSSGGGPTIAQWLRWYGHSWKETIDIMRRYFPELWNQRNNNRA